MNLSIPFTTTITTPLHWEDIVLQQKTLAEVGEIINWLKQKDSFEKKEIAKRLKPGYSVLFSGASGTGKTLTATLIGKTANKPVLKIDLKGLLSKYIGETEKNLDKIFDEAVASDAILFFDEADALFGKRTEVKDAHDKYANQEVSYLLKKMESFAGVSIFAAGLKSNIDEAFIRRFTTRIYFPAPDSGDRLKIWKNLFVSLSLSKDIDIQDVAEKYEITPGVMTNALRFASIKMQEEKEKELTNSILIEAIKREIKN